MRLEPEAFRFQAEHTTTRSLSASQRCVHVHSLWHMEQVLGLCMIIQFHRCGYLRNEFNFWNVHGIMNTSGLVQSKASRAK